MKDKALRLADLKPYIAPEDYEDLMTYTNRLKWKRARISDLKDDLRIVESRIADLGTLSLTNMDTYKEYLDAYETSLREIQVEQQNVSDLRQAIKKIVTPAVEIFNKNPNAVRVKETVKFKVPREELELLAKIINAKLAEKPQKTGVILEIDKALMK